MIFKIEGDGEYSLTIPECELEYRARYVRRERSGELGGELSVAAGIVGAKVVDGVLSTGTFNFSSVQARSQRAKLLRERARTGSKIDYLEHLEALCQYIAQQERFGQPAVILRDVQVRPDADRAFDVLGLRFPGEHLSILFGAGDGMKSYLALYIAGEVAERGGSVLYCDWELSAEDHRRRLGAIYGQEMPETIRYCRCDRPLVQEIDRLRRIVRSDRITFAVLDSVAYGTQGDPAEAGAAMEFCRATGQLGIGCIAIAHITKNGETNDLMPYGSVFWHNSARMTWNVKRSNTTDDGRTVAIGCFNRKSNLGAKRPPVGIAVQFDGDRVYFNRTDLATIDDMAEMLPLWQRIRQVVKGGPLPLHAIASELNHDNVESLDRTVRKHKHLFTKITGADGVHRIALVERRAS